MPPQRSSINWKTVVLLSLLGVAAALAVKFGLTERLYLAALIWLVFPILSGIIIARTSDKKLFLHGFITASLGGFWMVAFDILLIQFRFSNTDTLQNALFIAGLIGAIILVPGLLTGTFTVLSGKIFHPKSN